MKLKDAGKKSKVLVIDDSELALTWAQTQLEVAGFAVVLRNEPLGSGLMIVREKPDLVLIDVSMPSISGDELVKLLKGHTRLHDALLVLYSDRPAAELEVLTASSGADGYLKKTADSDAFIRRVRTLLARKRRA